jgi:hypothetical protein
MRHDKKREEASPFFSNRSLAPTAQTASLGPTALFFLAREAIRGTQNETHLEREEVRRACIPPRPTERVAFRGLLQHETYTPTACIPSRTSIPNFKSILVEGNIETPTY